MVAIFEVYPKLKEPDAMQLCLQWIESCVILHNLLLDLDDGVDLLHL